MGRRRGDHDHGIKPRDFHFDHAQVEGHRCLEAGGLLSAESRGSFPNASGWARWRGHEAGEAAKERLALLKWSVSSFFHFSHATEAVRCLFEHPEADGRRKSSREIAGSVVSCRPPRDIQEIMRRRELDDGGIRRRRSLDDADRLWTRRSVHHGGSLFCEAR
jgi:hypothetical protein